MTDPNRKTRRRMGGILPSRMTISTYAPRDEFSRDGTDAPATNCPSWPRVAACSSTGCHQRREKNLEMGWPLVLHHLWARAVGDGGTVIYTEAIPGAPKHPLPRPSPIRTVNFKPQKSIRHISRPKRLSGFSHALPRIKMRLFHTRQTSLERQTPPA